MPKIEPEFEIDINGRVICKFHSNYSYLIDEKKDFFQEFGLDIELNCIKCSHYESDDCYFSKERIDLIEKKRNSHHYKCKICGGNIYRMLTITHKLILEELYDVQIPLICCNCYDQIVEGELIKDCKNTLYFSILMIFASIFFLMFSIFILETFGILSIFIIIWIIPWSWFMYRALRKIILILSGIRYYKKFYLEK